MIKLFVSDLDGTLLNEHHIIDEESASTIKAAQANGYAFMVATGRSNESVRVLLKEHNIECKCILLNGAIYQDEQEKVIRDIPLDNIRARRIIDILEVHGINAHYYTSKGTAGMHPEKVSEEFRTRIMSQDGLSEQQVDDIIKKNNFFTFDVVIKDIDEYFQKNPVIYKIEAFSNDDAKMEKVRSAIQEVDDIAISNSIGNNFELTDIHAQKGYTLAHVCEELGYAKEEVAVFGDSMNDLNMMELFPNSYAMENASSLIKDAATFVIGKNSEQAVSNEIKAIMKLQDM